MSAISISFDPSHNPEMPTMVLMKRSGEIFGQIDSKSVVTKDQFTNASEITFSVNKYVDGELTPLWDKITDFKLVLCVEWKTVFEITIDISESTETTKSVYGTELAQAELSQIMLFNNEFNTEIDIARDDYKNPTVLYKPDTSSESLLHRMLEKAPHYRILHVDSSIRNIQRTFSFDNVSLYDALTQVGEEMNCVFIYDSSLDADGNIVRGISAYDLETVCNGCGHRGDFTGICPECGGTNLREGYGDDTTIFITSDELASNIQLSTDTGSVKNCFKLEAGDDLMTATIKNCNPNGSDYLWYISDAVKADMSDKLVKRIEDYDKLYAEYQKSHVYSLNSSKIAEYNAIIKKYLVYDSKLELITTPVVSYPALMNIYYNTIDLALYLESALMPDTKLSDTNAKEQLSKLTTTNLSPCAVAEFNYMSGATADNVVMQMARALTDARYKIEIIGSSLTNNSTYYTWVGTFQVTNYYDSEDTATGTSVQVVINNDYQAYVLQKMTAALHDKDTTDLSVTGLFEMSDTAFKAELKKYALNRLVSFQSACQACLDILIEQGVSTSSTWAGKNPNLYDSIYTPYYTRLGYIEAEIKVRENELAVIKGVEDEDGKIVKKGLQQFILELVEATQKALDFEKYIGAELWKEFITFRRESKFSNTNYVSDGLDNTQLFQNAREFIKVAQKEIFKSAERQHSITSTLKNLLVMKKFQPLVSSFKVGNWLRIQIDDEVYKLRLLKYEIDFDNLENTSVEFSDVFKTMDGLSDQQSLIQKTTQMATSYNTTQRQASKGADGQATVASWYENGIDSSATKIISENSSGQDQTWDEHGMLFRRKNPYLGGYDNIQMKIINSTLSITDDNWKNTKTAVGLFKYQDPKDGQLKSAYGINGELIIGKLLIGEGLGIYNRSASMSFDENGLNITNGDVFYTVNPNSHLLFKIGNKDGNALSFNKEGDLVIVGNITAKSLTLLSGATVNATKVNGLSDVAVSGSYNDLKDKPTIINFSGSYNDLENKPNLSLVATSGSYNDLTDKPNFAKVATSGSYNDLSDKPTFSYENIEGIPKLALVATSGSYTDLTDTPKLSDVAISGRYSDLTGIPLFAAVAKTGSYNDLENKPNLSLVATSGSYNDLTDKPMIPDVSGTVDVSGKLDVPTNHEDATTGMMIVKTETGSVWQELDLSGYLEKKQSESDVGKFLYVDENGNIIFITIEEIKTLLGISNTQESEGA